MRKRSARLGAVLALLAVLILAAAIADAAMGGGSAPRSRNAPHTRAATVGGSAFGRPVARGIADLLLRERRAIRAVLRFMPVVRAGGTRRRLVALTFDDGPSPYTPQIVSVLARMRTPATFFVVGQQLPLFAAGVHDELRHGFVIGDHTENHPWMIQLRPAAQLAQITDVAAQLHHLGAPAPLLFRPPYGAYDQVTLGILHRLGMLGVMWSVDPGDWRRPGTRAIVSGVLSAVHPGSIVLMHDGGGDRTQTVAALPSIIRGLRRRGYRLVSVPQLMAIDPPAPARRATLSPREARHVPRARARRAAGRKAHRRHGARPGRGHRGHRRARGRLAGDRPGVVAAGRG
ncbi:MAG: polysaccharide deacetylase family protein [Solirubrobacteraceae bacterium]